MAHHPLLAIGPKSLFRLRRNLRLQEKLNPGRNLALLWHEIRRKAIAIKARLARRDSPDDPYAMVTARTRPRVPRRSGSVAVDPYEY